MDMPQIKKCKVMDCAYNRNNVCHALAITVGGPEGDSRCDTYWRKEGMEGGDPERSGRVGACHMASCAHNERLECAASSINVGLKEQKADCLTYEKRM